MSAICWLGDFADKINWILEKDEDVLVAGEPAPESPWRVATALRDMVSLVR